MSAEGGAEKRILPTPHPWHAGHKLTAVLKKVHVPPNTVIKFWTDETSGIALTLKTGVPTYQVEDEEGRTHLLIHLPIEGQNEHHQTNHGINPLGQLARVGFSHDSRV
jgi:hypothetical protein